MKRLIPLNDGWLFCDGFSRSMLDARYEFENFYPVSIPHNAAPSPVSYSRREPRGAVYTYMRIIALDEKYSGSRLELKFDGISSYAEIYINGVFVTSHKGDSPFTVDVTAPLKAGFQNCVVVKVDSVIKRDVPLSIGLGPVPAYGGIHRRVWLSVVDGAEIADTFVKTTKFEEGGVETEIDVTLGDFYPEATLWCDIFDADGAIAGRLPSKTVLSREVTLKGVLSGVSLWSTENPVLYDAVVTLKYGDEILDVSRTRFGFRKAEFKRDGFYLNGTRLKLIGLNRQDCFPVVGRAATESLQRFDARKIKELGCNVVRTLGLADKSFIEECDSIGLLVVSGISGNGYIGGSAWKTALVKTVEDTVKSYRNSPSVIAWGVRVNNSPDCDELYFKTCKAAHENDPTRATMGSRNFMGSRLYEDVFAYNDYKKSGGLSRLKKTCRLFVPYFVSEHTGRLFPTKRCDGEARRTEQALRHLRVIDEAFANKNVSGAAGMSFADFGSIDGSGDGVMYYGVTDAYRVPKTAAYAYMSLKGKDKPFLQPSSSLAPDEFDGTLRIFTNCDSVKLYRDGKLVGEYFPSKNKYKHLPHPPVEITDFIGFLAADEEKMGARTAKIFKYIVGKVKKREGLFNLTLFEKIAAFILRKVLRLKTAQFRKLVHKYAYAPAVFSAEGIIDGAVAVERRITSDECYGLKLSASETVIRPSASYETVLVTVQSTDGAGNILDYDFSPVNISVEGELRLIGENMLSLRGGAVGFFLATTPYDGHARVTVSSRYKEVSIDLEVIHERVEEL